jgi:predicted  nucleic acid-binding Zn-ribbon protein
MLRLGRVDALMPAMIPRELLDRLRGLNQAARALRQTSLSGPEREKWEAQLVQLRAGLPTALLGQHDRLTRAGQESVAAVTGTCCGSCHMKLPVGMLAELNQPGRIAVCPHCGVFLFKESAVPTHPPV